jgi:hypothetical protein
MQRHLPHTSTRLSTPETRRLVGQGGNLAEPETTPAVAAATTKYHGYHHGNFALIAETGRDGPGQRACSGEALATSAPTGRGPWRASIQTRVSSPGLDGFSPFHRYMYSIHLVMHPTRPPQDGARRPLPNPLAATHPPCVVLFVFRYPASHTCMHAHLPAACLSEQQPWMVGRGSVSQFSRLRRQHFPPPPRQPPPARPARSPTRGCAPPPAAPTRRTCSAAAAALEARRAPSRLPATAPPPPGRERWPVRQGGEGGSERVGGRTRVSQASR